MKSQDQSNTNKKTALFPSQDTEANPFVLYEKRELHLNSNTKDVYEDEIHCMEEIFSHKLFEARIESEMLLSEALKVSELMADIQILKNTNDSKDKEIANLKKEIDEYKKKLDFRNQELLDIESNYQSATQKLLHYKNQIDTLCKEKEQLVEQNSNMEATFKQEKRELELVVQKYKLEVKQLSEAVINNDKIYNEKLRKGNLLMENKQLEIENLKNLFEKALKKYEEHTYVLNNQIKEQRRAFCRQLSRTKQLEEENINLRCENQELEVENIDLRKQTILFEARFETKVLSDILFVSN
jgi:chromosome segregation ATPase